MELRKNEKISANTAELEISVGREEFETACQAAYRKNAGKINVPGFRRGKAPRKMIEKMYGESVFYEDAVNIAYPDAYHKAVEEAGIAPVDRAQVEILNISSEGFTFKATVAVKPEVTLGDYKAIRAEKKIVPVTTAVLDYEGFADNVPFEG